MIPAKSQNRRRRILCNFIFALALAVAGREVPECAHLDDDVSNDGTAVSCVQEAVPGTPSHDDIPHKGLKTTRSFVFVSRVRISTLTANPASKNGQALLHLLTLQRK